MKRILIWSCVAVVLVVGGVAFARASARGWCGGHGPWRGHFGPAAFVAHQLKLSDTQRQQIHTLWEQERPTVAGLVREFAAENREMEQATANGNADESKVQEIAARQGATLAKLLVEKQHFIAKVYATVLNADQRAKADQMQLRMQDRLDHISKGME